MHPIEAVTLGAQRALKGGRAGLSSPAIKRRREAPTTAQLLLQHVVELVSLPGNLARPHPTEWLCCRNPQSSDNIGSTVTPMTRRTLFLLLAIALTPLVRPTAAQSAPEWTPSQRQAVLDKAEHGDRSSQVWLGCAYEQGWFGDANFSEALKWFRRAAVQGDPDAEFSLGQMYADGDGVPQNYKIAADWYRKAAEHVPDYGGAGQGRNSLGLLYLEGRGVRRNPVMAYMWLRLANDDDEIAFARSQMTPAEIAEAERLTMDWQRRHSAP